MVSRSPRTLYVIHHSHTDIGYTELQHRIGRWHVGFIRQALKIIDRGKSSDGVDWSGFKWNCESFWAVEQFLKTASKREILQLQRAVLSGRIGISASFLNFNELLDYDLVAKSVAKAEMFGRSIGVPIDSAMTADINGFGWGFSDALLSHGVRNLFTCIHTHHGMYPLKRQMPFWWESPGGDRLLVWNGEHYHIGNELGLVPGAVSSYMIKDECDAEMIYSDHWGVAEIRIPRLYEQLEASGYPYDFLPVMVSGLRTDNAPPNSQIMDFIDRWHKKHGADFRVEMITLSEFFGVLRQRMGDIPVYRGDWPDWWSDGTAGNPEYTRMFRQAQRDLWYYGQLTNRYEEIIPVDSSAAEDNLMLYAEHTFGHSYSVLKPWHPLVHGVGGRKKAFAALALEASRTLLDDALGSLGAADLMPGRPLLYKVINPLNSPVSGITRLVVGHFEYHELGFDRGAEVFDLETGKSVAYQIDDCPSGMEFCVAVSLRVGEERLYRIEPNAGQPVGPPDSVSLTDEGLETPYVSIRWQKGAGVSSWIDKVSGRDMIRPDRDHNPFTPVHEVTPVPEVDQVMSVRGAMGLNRKGENVVRSEGKLESVKLETKGSLFCRAQLRYAVAGTSFCVVELTAFYGEPRVDVAVRMVKDSIWEPENVYLALPFTGGERAQLWLDKAGVGVRPRIDQLPGTLIDFYSIQEGLAFVSDDWGMVVATPDSNLIQLGDLDYGERKLHDPKDCSPDRELVYAWLMTNYWETNFEAGLGGFYEFRFSVKWGDDLVDPERALRACREINVGVRSNRLEIDLVGSNEK